MKQSCNMNEALGDIGPRETDGHTMEPSIKRTQHCTFCKNHGDRIAKKGHRCPYQDCPCILCKLTKSAQTAMRHQQRVWRHQKQNLKCHAGNAVENEESTSQILVDGSNKCQVCDKCRNHNKLVKKRNHQCPYLTCDCDYCSLTFKRREIMKHQQRVRRSRITSKPDPDTPSEEENIEQNADPDSLRREEELDQKYSEEVPAVEEIKSREEPHEVKLAKGSGKLTNNWHDNMLKRDLNCKGVTQSPSEVSSKMEEYDSRSFSHLNHHNSQFSFEEDKRSKLVIKPLTPSSLGDARNSPPPLIHVSSSRTSSPTAFYSRSKSRSPPYAMSDETTSPERMRHVSSPSLRYPLERSFQTFNKANEEEPHPTSLFLFSNTSMRGLPSSYCPPFPYSNSRPLQNLSALNASLEHSMRPMKFGAQLEDFHLRNSNWMSSAFISSSLGSLSPNAPSLLQQQQPTPHHTPLRPRPVNLNHQPHPGLPQSLWSHMLLPCAINFAGIHNQTSSSSACLERFPGIVGATRFAHGMDLFH